jgi:hypothetical protein
VNSNKKLTIAPRVLSPAHTELACRWLFHLPSRLPLIDIRFLTSCSMRTIAPVLASCLIHSPCNVLLHARELRRLACLQQSVARTQPPPPPPPQQQQQQAMVTMV